MRIAKALVAFGFVLLVTGFIGALAVCPGGTCPSDPSVAASGFAIIAGVVLVPISGAKLLLDRRRSREAVPPVTPNMTATVPAPTTVPANLDATVRIWSGGLYDYWFAPNEILKVRAVSNLAIALSTVAIGAGFVFGLVGGLVGALVSGVILRRSAKSMRTRLYAMPGPELAGMKLINSTIPYSTIWKADIKGTSLILALPRKRIRLKLASPSLRQEAEILLRSKLGEKLTFQA